MKKKLLILTVLILIPFNISFAQSAPIGKSTFLVGPVSVDGHMALQIGYAKEIYGVQLAGFGDLGKTVETQVEAAKLFQVHKGLYAGPIAGGGVDWSEYPGTESTPVEAYLFGAAGFAVVYSVTEKIGGWGFYKARMEKEFNPKFGFGVYYRI